MKTTKIFRKCPLCAKHFLDLRLHIWAVHLDALEKKGILNPKKDYSKVMKFVPKAK